MIPSSMIELRELLDRRFRVLIDQGDVFCVAVMLQRNVLSDIQPFIHSIVLRGTFRSNDLWMANSRVFCCAKCYTYSSA
ncbi:hypothetical protein LIER_20329 [Lithospermum erythrorhizon]|uniref:Uncharacterized protein n=1 Tax=Lithospermum erythrorhizon TaxID=34254 RepID=A0AAV3QL57_LITER